MNRAEFRGTYHGKSCPSIKSSHFVRRLGGDRAGRGADRATCSGLMPAAIAILGTMRLFQICASLSTQKMTAPGPRKGLIPLRLCLQIPKDLTVDRTSYPPAGPLGRTIGPKCPPDKGNRWPPKLIATRMCPKSCCSSTLGTCNGRGVGAGRVDVPGVPFFVRETAPGSSQSCRCGLLLRSSCRSGRPESHRLSQTRLTAYPPGVD
jgi:hypothetical protein